MCEQPWYCNHWNRQCRFDKFFNIGCPASCHFVNFWCSQWWFFFQNDISMIASITSPHWGWNKFTVILQTCNFLQENLVILINKFCKSALVQVMAWCWTGDKPLPEPTLTYCQLDPEKDNIFFLFEVWKFALTKMHLKMLPQNGIILHH